MLNRSFGQLLILANFLLISSSLHAAYVFQTVPAQAFDTVTTDVVWSNDPTQTDYPIDDDFQVVNIGFTFYLGETGYNQVTITSNGALHFGANQGFHKDYSNEALPITGFVSGPGFEEPADRVIAGYWDDLEPGSGGTVRYGILGTAPNRRFVVSWEGVPRYNSPLTSYTLQIVLYENGDVRFRYGNDDVNGSSATIGIEVNDTDFTEYSYNTFNAINDSTDILWTRELPTLLSAQTDCSDNTKVTVTFAAPISPARGQDPNNFTINNGITVISANLINSTTVELTTTPLNSGVVYTLTTSTPTQSINFQHGTLTTNTFADQFNSVSYGNNDGTSAFTGNWIESGDDGSPSGGNITISNNQLRLDDRPNSGGRPSIEREVDLSGYTNATLSFDYATSGNLEPSDEFHIDISTDGGTNWTLLASFTNDVSGTFNQDISAYISPNTRVRFQVFRNYGGPNEFMAIDNLLISANTYIPCNLIDHYRLSFSSPVVTCERANITVTAEDASNNAILIPAGTTLTMSTDIANDGWTNPAGAASASYTLPADANSVIFQLAKLTPATLEIDVIDNNGSTEIRTPDSDFIDFVDAAFRFYGDGTVDNIGDQIAGKPSDIAPNNQTVTIRAIQTDPATGRCEALLSPGTVNIGLAYQCTNPASCAIASGGMNINGSTAINDVNSGYTPVPITFDATGTGTLNFNYFDVGQIQLAAQAALPVGSSGNVTVSGSSNPFIVSPFGFDIAVNGDPYADDGNDPVYTTAGAAFQTTIRSVLWQAADDLDNDGIPDPFVDTDGDGIPDSGGDLSDNGVTPNIAAIAGSIALSPTAQVVTNNNGTLGVNSINFSSFDAPGNPGAGTYTFNQSWSEVGILQLDALSTNFMGSGRNASGRRINIGRFRPDNFLLTINPIAAQCGTFTYGGFNDGINPGLNKQGQLFTLSGTITARNAANVTTNNYQGVFAKLQSGDINAQAFNVTAGANASGTLNFTSAPLNFAGGSSAFSDAASHYQFDTLAGAFDLRADLTATDSDGASSGVVNSNSVNMRLGRLRLLDAYGPEFVDLEMRLQAEYFDGANWVLNSADSCSVYIDSDASFVAGSYTDQLNPGETNIFAPNLQQNLLNGISALGNGLWFSSPGAGNFGSVQVEVNLGAQPWLQFDWTGDNAIDNATAGLHFGYYRGSDRVIYWQEIQN